MTVMPQDSQFSFIDVDTPFSDAYEPWWGDQRPGVYAPDPMAQIQRRMLLILTVVVLFIFGSGFLVVQRSGVKFAFGTNVDQAAAEVVPVSETESTTEAVNNPAPPPATGGIAPLFTREVQHWAPQIVAWSAAAGLDPNMVATVMQIESCGDPNAVSSAGAQGLFQVMPFHFSAGENMQDPDTNAKRGLDYLALGMSQTGGDAARTFAGYNGGHGTATKPWDAWPNEMQRYYVWSTGIYEAAQNGSATSETLDRWLAAGGAGLCQQAAARLGLQ